MSAGATAATADEEAARKAGGEELLERGSPVEVQQELHQEEAAGETGGEELLERGSPVEVQQTDAGGEMRRPIIVVAVEDEGDEDDPHHATRSQVGHPVPGHQRWDPGKWHSELRENEELRPGRNSPSFEAATGRRTNRGSVSPAYGFSALALVKCSNEEGPGPRHNMKEDPGTFTLVMKGEHGQEVPCDPGQVTAILGTTCPPLLPPPHQGTQDRTPSHPLSEGTPHP
jgi:hypothetical protein